MGTLRPSWRALAVYIVHLRGDTQTFMESIGCIYRPPDGDTQTFMESYANIIQYLSSTECYICGDFNIDLRSKSLLSEQFLNMNISSCFTPIITKPTRSQGRSNTLIDNIFINNYSSIKETGIVLSDISDHYPLYRFRTD